MIVLLPCYSLEDLTLDRPSDEAEQLLSAWSALFHPTLMRRLDRLPTWGRASYRSTGTEHRLVVVPPCVEPELAEEWRTSNGEEETLLVTGLADRSEIVAAALDALQVEPAAGEQRWADDFLALGLCHMLIELLTCQLRYMSNLDEYQFERDVKDAYRAAAEEDDEKVASHLRSAFELLTEAREYFFPTETYLVDWLLTAGSTLGEELRDALDGAQNVSLLLSGSSLETMAAHHPATLASLQRALDEGRVCVAGGECDEVALPLFPLDAMRAHLERGRATYEKHVGSPPRTFARRRFGLTPAIPTLARLVGFDSAVHFTLDDGRFPKGEQSKVLWHGFGNASVQGLARIPLDAAQPSAFLKLPHTLGETMDMDHAATAVLAHWPGRASSWMEDLVRMGRHAPALGQWTTLTDYFTGTGAEVRYGADHYQSPYLRQEVARAATDPISRWTRFYRRHALARAVRGLDMMASVVGEPSAGGADASQRLVEAAEDPAVLEREPDGAHETQLEASLVDAIELASRRFVDGVTSSGSTAPSKARVLVNPWSFARRLHVQEIPKEGNVQTSRSVRSVYGAEGEDQRGAVVDLPAMGYACVMTSPEAPRPAPVRRRRRWFGRSSEERPPVMADEAHIEERHVYRLQNEYFEAHLDPITGALRSIYAMRGRGNRLAQQVAFRMPPTERARDGRAQDDPNRGYSIMAADAVDIVATGQGSGEIATRGRLVSTSGETLARFQQSFRVERGTPLIYIDGELELVRLPEGDPWDCYYCMRWAWGDATVDVLRSVHGTAHPTELERLEAPMFVDLRTETARTTLFTCGLPYHRRHGLRQLDSILIVPGETSTRYRMAVGVDLEYPAAQALPLMLPREARDALVVPAAAPSPPEAWLFRVDCRNVLVTDWAPIIERNRVVGFQAFVLETEGRGGPVQLAAFRPIGAAQSRTAADEEPRVWETNDGVAVVHVEAYSYLPVEATFADASS